MKKSVIALAVLSALLLSGCGLGDQIASVRENYIDPALEEARTGVARQEEPKVGAGPNLKTDRSGLTAYSPGEAVFSRAQEGYISELAVSDSYGLLLPFDGSLVTGSGEIVLDGGVEVRFASEYSLEGYETYLRAYVLYNGEKYAVCGFDGSWLTDFEFESVFPMALGLVCVRDGSTNNAVCLSENGEVVFDMMRLSVRTQLAPGSVSSLVQYGAGYMLIDYFNGQHGFMDAAGTVLNRDAGGPSWFDGALPFSEGLAAVSKNGAWGYLSADGQTAIAFQFEEATSFSNGLAAVKKDGVWRLIGTDGETRREFPEASSVTVSNGCVTVDGEYYSASTLERAVFYGYEGVPCDGGFWVSGENGVRVFLNNGNQLYFSGAEELAAHAGELWMVKLKNNAGTAVLDVNSRVAVCGDSEFIKDALTGASYVLASDGKLYSSGGTLLTESCTGLVAGGYVYCAEGLWQGIKNPDGEWVFRVPADFAD